MPIKERDVKLLWGRSGNRCAICRLELSSDERISSASFPLGQQAHIIARESTGPRGNSPLSPEDRDSYPNLILLCPTHHSLIDKAIGDYPPETLHALKSKHEQWVRETLSDESSDGSRPTLASAYEALHKQDYTGSIRQLKLVSLKERETPTYCVLCALSILAGRPINRISSTERGLIIRHLLRAKGIDDSWGPTLALMALIDIDYCELHGLSNDFGLSSLNIESKIGIAHRVPLLENLIASLPMSQRARAIIERKEGSIGPHN